MKKRFLLPLLLAAPLFFMGNSPAPWAHPTEYEDFTMSVTSYEYIEETHDYLYTMEINNTGDRYFVLDQWHASDDEVHLGEFEDIYFDQLLRPGESGTFHGRSMGDYSDRELVMHAYAYQITSECSFTKATFNYESNNKTDYSYYFFDVEGMKSPDKNYYYSTIIEVTVEGQKQCFSSSGVTDGSVSFCNRKELNPDDISIDRIYFVQGRKKNSGGFYAFLNVIFGFFTVLVGIGGVSFAVFAFVFTVFLIFVIIPGVVILIVRPWKKREKKKE